MTDDLSNKVLRWMAKDDIGSSSKTIALWLAIRERPRRGPDAPSDPADLGRCLRLLRTIPELRDRMPEMAECSPQWKHMLTYWDEITQSMLDEVGINWEKANCAPKTYDLMKQREKVRS